MSDAKNLNDFFAQQSKKKKNKKAGGTQKAQPAAAKQADEEIKDEPVAVVPESQNPPAQDFADSSDEESNTIVINEGRQKIIDRKDLEASKKNKEEESSDATAGWGLGSKLGQVEENTTFKASSTATTKTQGGAGMNFGKPQFTRKARGIMDNQDFPDLATGSTGGNAPEQSKANSAMQYSFGAAAKGAREEQEPAEERKAATKPFFKGKAKLNTGPVATDVGGVSYDFSKMRMSAATTKKTEGAEGEEKPDGERRRAAPSFAFDDDFEVVKEKVKPVRKAFEEPKFGGGMPSFSRGGANAK